MTKDVVLGLGSNVGDREGNLALAVAGLARRGFVAERRSSIYATEPVDAPVQDWFLNAAVRGATVMTPEELLRACLAAEQELGRVRDVYHGPRTLDIDVLLCGAEVRRTPELMLPHPGLPARRFVLVPVAEIAPDLRHPILGRTMAELLLSCPDTARVVRHLPAEAWT